MGTRTSGWRKWLGAALIMAASSLAAAATDAAGGAGELPIAAAGGKAQSTADHSKFKELEGPFKSGPEVTKACLSCHTEASHQVMKSIHWTWEATSPTTGQAYQR